MSHSDHSSRRAEAVAAISMGGRSADRKRERTVACLSFLHFPTFSLSLSFSLTCDPPVEEG